MRTYILSTLVAGVLVTQTGCDSRAAGGSSERDPSRWSWLAADGGTYWYVPAENLLAYQWNVNAPQSPTPIDDQTVWHIQNFDGGYFFGPVVAQLVGHPRVCQYATGSVTPDGRVYLSFTPVRAVPLGTPALTTGLGQMVHTEGEWTFNMQMASGSSEAVTHWAFMLQCRPDDPCWSNLPGTGQSVPDMLASCDDS